MSEQEPNRDQYIQSLFEEGGVEEPSKRFTNNIIEAINAESTSSAYTYKPIISKSAWLTIAFIGVAAFIYLLFIKPTGGEGIDLYGYSLSLDFSKVKGLFNKVAFSFELSPIFKTSIIALFIFTFTNLIIFELKNRSIFK